MPRKRRRQGTSQKVVERGIYLRPSGKLVVPIHNEVTGKRDYSHPDHPRGGWPNTPAGLKAARKYKQAREAEKAARPSQGDVMCDDYARRWPKEHPRGESTNINARQTLGPFRKDFAGVRMRDVTRRLARLYILGGVLEPDMRRFAKLAAGWSGSTVEGTEVVVAPHRNAHKLLRAMWNDAIRRDGVVVDNPWAAMGLPGNGDSTRGELFLTVDELELLVSTAEHGLPDAKDDDFSGWGDYGRETIGPFLITAAGAGLRPGELFALKWPRVDFDQDVIHVMQQRQNRTGKYTLPKGGKTRVVPMLPVVRAALQGVRERSDPEARDGEFVFHTVRGLRMTQRNWNYYWGKLREAFYVQLPEVRQEEVDPGFDFYELRHYFGSYLGGLPDVKPWDIADAMGHADGGEMAMKLYIHSRSEDSRGRIMDAVRADQARLVREA